MMNQAAPKYPNYIPMRELADVHVKLFPFDVWSKLRQSTPVRYDPVRKCWDVFRYEDVQYVLKNPALFSSQRNRSNESILFMDPPKHKQMRDLVNKAFTPRAIEELEPRIRRITDELLQVGISEGAVELVSQLATPLPVIVIAELLGVPVEDRSWFKHWSDVLVKGAEDDSEEAFSKLMIEKEKTQNELDEYFENIIGLRRNEPKDDLVSLLIAADIDGEKLTERDIIGFCVLLLAAGNETTTNLITNAVRVLAEQPDLQDELRTHPESLPAMVEETLRYYPPIASIARKVVESVELGGQTISPGELVVCWIASANRDEEKFEDAELFRLDRKRNPHLSFGLGIHFCLGAPLARLEARVALQAVTQRMRNISIPVPTQLEPIPSPFVFGVTCLPISFEKSSI